MQKSKADFYPVLLLGVLSNALLRLHTGYWARAGLLAAPLSAAVLAAVLLALSACWPYVTAPLRCGLCALLAAGSALEVLRLYALLDSVYPGSLSLAAVCFAALAPVVYLRRAPALRQTANAVLALGAVGLAVLVLSVAPRLRVVHLNAAPLTAADWQSALCGQLALAPELLLFAVWPPQAGQRTARTLGLGAAAVWFDAAVHLFLELFFGAAMPNQLSPVHAAAQCGALSVFNRLEWLQLVLWCMAVSVKLGLYLYAAVEVSGGRAGRGGSAAGLDRYPVYFACIALLCALWRGAGLEQAFWWRSAACWVLAALIILQGGCRWLTGLPASVPKRSA